MDWRAALAVAQGGGRAERRVLDRGGRCGGSEGRFDPSAREGSGRLPRGLWHEWRSAASSARLPTAADRAGIRRDSSDQVLEAGQGRGPLLHDVRRLRAYQRGSEGRGVGASNWTEI